MYIVVCFDFDFEFYRYGVIGREERKDLFGRQLLQEEIFGQWFI